MGGWDGGGGRGCNIHYEESKEHFHTFRCNKPPDPHGEPPPPHHPLHKVLRPLIPISLVLLRSYHMQHKSNTFGIIKVIYRLTKRRLKFRGLVSRRKKDKEITAKAYTQISLQRWNFNQIYIFMYIIKYLVCSQAW